MAINVAQPEKAYESSAKESFAHNKAILNYAEDVGESFNKSMVDGPKSWVQIPASPFFLKQLLLRP